MNEMKYKENMEISEKANYEDLSTPPPPPPPTMAASKHIWIDEVGIFKRPWDSMVVNSGKYCRTCGWEGGHIGEECPVKPFFPFLFPSPPSSPKREGSKDDGNWLRIWNVWDLQFPSDLKALFEDFGTVTKACILLSPQKNKQTTSEGVGFVNFVNKTDAERAVADLDCLRYKGRTLRVESVLPKLAHQSAKTSLGILIG